MLSQVDKTITVVSDLVGKKQHKNTDAKTCDELEEKSGGIELKVAKRFMPLC